MSLRLITDDLSREQKLKLVYAAWMRADEAGVASMFTEDCEFQLMGNPVLKSPFEKGISRSLRA
jgi:ketosteroid isomerase-like protein